MRPDQRRKRREARAAALHKPYGDEQDEIQVDAAWDEHLATADAYTPNTPASIKELHQGTEPETAEEVAIALALGSSMVTYILSGSKAALRNYARAQLPLPPSTYSP